VEPADSIVWCPVSRGKPTRSTAAAGLLPSTPPPVPSLSPVRRTVPLASRPSRPSAPAARLPPRCSPRALTPPGGPSGLPIRRHGRWGERDQGVLWSAQARHRRLFRPCSVPPYCRQGSPASRPVVCPTARLCRAGHHGRPTSAPSPLRPPDRPEVRASARTFRRTVRPAHRRRTDGLGAPACRAVAGTSANDPPRHGSRSWLFNWVGDAGSVTPLNRSPATSTHCRNVVSTVRSSRSAGMTQRHADARRSARSGQPADRPPGRSGRGREESECGTTPVATTPKSCLPSPADRLRCPARRAQVADCDSLPGWRDRSRLTAPATSLRVILLPVGSQRDLRRPRPCAKGPRGTGNRPQVMASLAPLPRICW